MTDRDTTNPSAEPPAEITVWACLEPDCDYWRQEKTTGVHLTFPNRGPDVPHPLHPVAYVPKRNA